MSYRQAWVTEHCLLGMWQPKLNHPFIVSFLKLYLRKLLWIGARFQVLYIIGSLPHSCTLALPANQCLDGSLTDSQRPRNCLLGAKLRQSLPFGTEFRTTVYRLHIFPGYPMFVLSTSMGHRTLFATSRDVAAKAQPSLHSLFFAQVGMGDIVQSHMLQSSPV